MVKREYVKSGNVKIVAERAYGTQIISGQITLNKLLYSNVMINLRFRKQKRKRKMQKFDVQ